MSSFSEKRDKDRGQIDELVEALTQEVMRRISPQSQATAKTTSIEVTSPSQIAPYIDHTLLKPDATAEQIKTLCEEARRYGFATCCVNSSQVRLAAELLKGSRVKAIAVVGFPLGASTAKAKAFETLESIRHGAEEIDTVINIGALKGRDYKTVFEDIKAVVDAAQPTPVKVILETSQLNDEEKTIACALSSAAGAAVVKTSTGFGGGGCAQAPRRQLRAGRLGARQSIVFLPWCNLAAAVRLLKTFN